MIININFDDLKSIKNAENQKAKIENKGFNLIKTEQKGLNKFETEYIKALSFGLKYFYSFKILLKRGLYDVIPFSARIPKGWNVIKEVV